MGIQTTRYAGLATPIVRGMAHESRKRNAEIRYNGARKTTGGRGAEFEASFAEDVDAPSRSIAESELIHTPHDSYMSECTMPWPKCTVLHLGLELVENA